MNRAYHEVIDMVSTSPNLNSTVLIDRNAMRNMRVKDVIIRLEQMSATGRYADIHVDYGTGEIVAEVLA